MPNLTRITIALDEETEKIVEKLSKEMGVSYSALIRAALKFFSQNKESAKDFESMKLWSSLLAKGEHIILDIDHWLLFLKYIESSDKKESFYEEGKKIAKSHAEQLAGITNKPEDYLRRLEACNFYKLNKDSENEYTLVLNSNLTKRFVKELVLETLAEMGFDASAKEDLAKLRLRIK
ncbi:MAG: ribbon-helix-helix protein, CopG family [Candidatus Hadarchaeales archaeon]